MAFPEIPLIQPWVALLVSCFFTSTSSADLWPHKTFFFFFFAISGSAPWSSKSIPEVLIPTSSPLGKGSFHKCGYSGKASGSNSSPKRVEMPPKQRIEKKSQRIPQERSSSSGVWCPFSLSQVFPRRWEAGNIWNAFTWTFFFPSQGIFLQVNKQQPVKSSQCPHAKGVEEVEENPMDYLEVVLDTPCSPGGRKDL